MLEIKTSIQLLIVLIKLGSDSSIELKSQGDLDRDLLGREMSITTAAWTDKTMGLYEHELTEESSLL